MQVNGVVNWFDEQADGQSLCQESSDVYDVFGDPKIRPRLGEDYQVEIPPLFLESDYSQFQNNPSQAESTGSTLHEFRVGLPIPLIWIKDEVENNKHDPLKNASKSIGVTNKNESSKQECIKETQNGPDYDKWNPKLEAIDSTSVNKMKLGELGNSNEMQETKIGMHEKHRHEGHFLVPGSASDTLNDIEEASFILGLYIFGKNLVQVKRFIGNKKMGDMLSFYYGKFYKSDRYQRWSGCRKMKSRKCIYGQKIFTGPRQQELLSRLQPKVSEECRIKLLEVLT